jgi:hypothetical protein
MKHFKPTEDELIKLLPEAFVIESPDRAHFDTFFSTLVTKPQIPHERTYPKLVSYLFRSPYFSFSISAVAVILILTSVSVQNLPSLNISNTSYESSVLLSKDTFAFLSDEESAELDSLISEVDTLSIQDLTSIEDDLDPGVLSFENEL